MNREELIEEIYSTHYPFLEQRYEDKIRECIYRELQKLRKVELEKMLKDAKRDRKNSLMIASISQKDIRN